MKALFLLPVVLSIAVLGAHFMRYGNVIGVMASLALIGLVFLRRAWVVRVIQAKTLQRMYGLRRHDEVASLGGQDH